MTERMPGSGAGVLLHRAAGRRWGGRWAGRGREGKNEPGPGRLAGLVAHRAAARLDELADDEHAQAGALLGGRGLAGPGEAVEQPRDELGGDAGTGVGDHDLDLLTGPRRGHLERRRPVLD